VRYVHLTKAKHIHERRAHLLVRPISRRKDYDRKGSVAKKKYSEAQRQDELIGGKPPVVK
jgi:hypothetical protein